VGGRGSGVRAKASRQSGRGGNQSMRRESMGQESMGNYEGWNPSKWEPSQSYQVTGLGGSQSIPHMLCLSSRGGVVGADAGGGGGGGGSYRNRNS